MGLGLVIAFLRWQSSMQKEKLTKYREVLSGGLFIDYECRNITYVTTYMQSLS